MIEQEYIDGIFNTLTRMDVELDPNPIEFGPSSLNEKTAKVRLFLSKTEKIFMEVSHSLARYKRDLLISENVYKISINRLIAEDPHVRSGRSQAEREAFAQARLSDLTSNMDDLRLNVNDLEELVKVIKAKRSDLKDLQGRLKDQLKLCQEQIALGQRWGSKKSTPVDQPKSEVVLEEDELDSIFAQALGQDKTQEVLESNASEDDLASFLNSEINEDEREMDDALDFSDILEKI